MERSKRDLYLRRIVMIGTPVIVGSLDLTHPVHFGMTGVYHDLIHHVDWWIALHVVQLVLFGLLGMSNYLLVSGVRGPASVISRCGTAVFVVFYSAFDSLVGLGNGILMKYAEGLPADQQTVLINAVDSFWSSSIAALVAAIGAIGWMVAVLCGIIARSEAKTRQWPLATLVTCTIAYGGVSVAMGLYNSPLWWGSVAVFGVLFGLLTRPGVAMGLLAMGTLLFTASHTPPFGPPGMLCYFLGMLLLETMNKRPTVPNHSA